MDNKEKIILKQVSLKAAASVGGTKEEVVANATFFNEWLLEGIDLNKEVSYPTGSTGDKFIPTCPSCKSEVWDNRDIATGNQPSWRCKNADCTGGTFSKKYNKQMAWASWDDDEFYNLELQFKNKNNTVEDKAIEAEVVDNPMTDDAKDEAPF